MERGLNSNGNRGIFSYLLGKEMMITRWLIVSVFLLGGTNAYSQSGIIDGMKDVKDSKKVLLSIGVDTFKFAPDLTYPASDAERFAKVLDYKKDTVLVGENATKENILGSIGRAIKEAGRRGIVVVFLSMHGTRSGALVPHDGSIHFPTTLIKSADLEVFSSKYHGKIVFIVDACYGGGVTSSKNTSVMSSSGFDHISYEDLSIEAGIFAYYFLESLTAGSDINNDNLLTAREIFQDLYDKVGDQSLGVQKPQMLGDPNVVLYRLDGGGK